MAVTIRLSRHGRKKLPFYRLVAADKAAKRDGRFLEVLGTVNPAGANEGVALKQDRIKYWIGIGAQCSDTANQIIEKDMPGYLSGIFSGRLDKLKAKRKARKARATKA